MNDAMAVREAVGRLLRGEASPAALIGVDRQTVDRLYEAGREALQKGQFARADTAFRKCMALEPSRSEVWLGLGAARQAAGAYTEAGDCYQVAALVSGDAAPIAYAAANFARAGQMERARVLAELARTRSGNDARLEPWLRIAERGTEGAR